jgi:hypothetical protein
MNSKGALVHKEKMLESVVLGGLRYYFQLGGFTVKQITVIHQLLSQALKKNLRLPISTKTEIVTTPLKNGMSLPSVKRVYTEALGRHLQDLTNNPDERYHDTTIWMIAATSRSCPPGYTIFTQPALAPPHLSRFHQMAWWLRHYAVYFQSSARPGLHIPPHTLPTPRHAQATALGGALTALHLTYEPEIRAKTQQNNPDVADRLEPALSLPLLTALHEKGLHRLAQLIRKTPGPVEGAPPIIQLKDINELNEDVRHNTRARSNKPLTKNQFDRLRTLILLPHTIKPRPLVYELAAHAPTVTGPLDNWLNANPPAPPPHNEATPPPLLPALRNTSPPPPFPWQRAPPGSMGPLVNAGIFLHQGARVTLYTHPNHPIAALPKTAQLLCRHLEEPYPHNAVLRIPHKTRNAPENNSHWWAQNPKGPKRRQPLPPPPSQPQSYYPPSRGTRIHGWRTARPHTPPPTRHAWDPSTYTQ